MLNPNPVLLRSLTHLAWVDGKLAEEEVTFLRALYRELGVELYLQEELLSQECPQPKEQELLIACPDPGTRRTFLQTAVDLAWSDGELSDTEWGLIKSWCWLFSMKIRSWQDLQRWLA